MRRLVLLVLVPLAAALAAAPAQADTRTTFRQSGELRIAWHGDPARGCVVAGVCDVQGTLSARGTPGAVGESLEGTLSFGPASAGTSAAGSRFPLVLVALDSLAVRARRGGSTCADSLDLSASFQVSPDPGGGLTVPLEFGGLSAARCAGPVAPDFDTLSIPGRLVGSPARGATLDLRSVSSTSAGPYAVTVTSTLALHLRSSSSNVRTVTVRRPPARPSRGRRVRTRRVLELTLGYQMEPARGTVALDYAGEAAPACEVLDACGTRGTMRYPFALAPGTFGLVAAGPAPRRGSLRAALAALRRGRLRAGIIDDGFVSVATGTISMRTERPGAPACVDSLPLGGPVLAAEAEGRRLTLSLAGAEALDGRCPGPLGTDAWPRGLMAHVSLPLTGARTLRTTLGAPGSFAGPGWTGRRLVSLPLVLHRTEASVRIVRVPR